MDSIAATYFRDWEGARVIERESDWRVRKTKEAICIKTEGAVMNRDEGAFLSGIYNPLFAGLRKFGGKSRVSELRDSSKTDQQESEFGCHHSTVG
ncbi:hypothetical protein MAR_007186 [Mya arenaria]|uniref:Uncharacterized protein n=1 Tax=Mya arenaria TaxID=6604 RepID=A0ABY7DI78_MYAAR|nr:hypothetical protein MAR_007186 [Mya arenaria]